MTVDPATPARAPAGAEPSGDGSAIPPEAARDALARVLADPQVRSAPRTADFLRHVVTETLEGRADELRERTIAVAALGRGPDFDPRIDPAVRVQAARVRRTLDRYYGGRGEHDPVRIVLAPGRYVPVFTRNEPLPASIGTPTLGPGVVVMSFTDHTPGGSHAYIAPGLSEVLVATLSRFPGCRVIGPVSTGDGPAPDPRAMGADHGADFVVLGSTRTHGGVLRAAARLIETRSGETVWSQIYDRLLDDAGTLDVEDEVVSEICAALADYRGAMFLRPPPGAASGDRLVHDAMMRYYGWLGDTNAEDFLPTVRGLEEAARREPDNSLVLSMLAGMNLVDAIDRIAGLENPMQRAAELANRAIALDPANPHAVAALAWLALAGGRVDECHERVEELLRLCPDHPTFLYRAGFVLAVTGQWERGVGLVEASLALNPNGPGYLNFFPAMDLCLRGDPAAALHRAYRVQTPGGHLGPLSRAVPLAKLGRLDEARAQLDALRAAVPAFDEDRPAALRRMLMPEPVLSMVLEAVETIEAAAA